MKIGLQPRLKPQINLKEIWAATIPSHQSISRFESRFSKKFNCDFGTMFSHGRTGLYALFKVWSLDQAEIICPAYTCVVVQHAIVLSGNIPVFVDSSEDTFNMNLDKLENTISEKTRAIVVTHLFGYPMDVFRINTIVQRAQKRFNQKIYIIQDCAHSYGAKCNGELVTRYGDAAIFGSNISKIMTSVFGGMVLTNDSSTHNRLQQFRQANCRKNGLKSFRRWLYLLATYVAFNPVAYAVIHWLINKGWFSSFVDYYQEDTIEFPKDWDEWPCGVEARVGLVQLDKYDKIVQARINNANAWMDALRNENIKFMDTPKGTTFSHCVGIVENRDQWLSQFLKQGVQLGELIEYSVPEMKAYQKYKKGKEFPNAKYYSEHTVNFPIWLGYEVQKR